MLGLRPERPTCFAQGSLSGDADVGEQMVVELDEVPPLAMSPAPQHELVNELADAVTQSDSERHRRRLLTRVVEPGGMRDCVGHGRVPLS